MYLLLFLSLLFPFASACYSHSDCPPNQKCIEFLGVCTPKDFRRLQAPDHVPFRCDNDYKCPIHLKCSEIGVCVKPDQIPIPKSPSNESRYCLQDNQCGVPYKKCFQPLGNQFGFCVPEWSDKTCKTSSPCESDEKCLLPKGFYLGMCVPKVNCGYCPPNIYVCLPKSPESTEGRCYRKRGRFMNF